MWTEIVLQMIFPILGIVLELASWRPARWVNIGFLIAAGCFWLGEALWWRSDPFFGVFLLLSLGMFVLAGLTQIIYHRTSPQTDKEQAPAS